MSKITLGTKPKTFKKFPVKFVMPDGESGQIGVTFKYRSRKEFAAYLNVLFGGNSVEKQDGDEKHDFVKLFEKATDKSVAQLLDAIDSWDFEYELSKETLNQLADELPVVLSALGAAYNAACTEGRLGN
jgi:hypothetical protein